VPVADLDGRPPDSGDRELLVGPAGGWSEAERALADAGGGRVQLAADVLRVETAAVAAASALALARLGALRG
jgi:RsmE family RNA methyltransferase